MKYHFFSRYSIVNLVPALPDAILTPGGRAPIDQYMVCYVFIGIWFKPS